MHRLRHRKLNLLIVVKRLVDVAQARGHLHALVNREAHAHRLVWLDVRVLADDDDADVLHTRVLVSVEDLLLGREASASLILFLDEFEQ